MQVADRAGFNLGLDCADKLNKQELCLFSRHGFRFFLVLSEHLRATCRNFLKLKILV